MKVGGALLSALCASCTALFPLDGYVGLEGAAGGAGGVDGGSATAGGTAGPSGGPTALLFGGQQTETTAFAHFDEAGRVTRISPGYPISGEWAGGGFFDGELVLISNDGVFRAPFDGGVPSPFVRTNGVARPDGRGSLVVGRGVAIASMGNEGDRLWTAALTTSGIQGWQQQPQRTSAERQDPRVLTDGAFVWLIGGESPGGDLTDLVEVAPLVGTSLGAFRVTTKLPERVSEPAVALARDRLAVCGGATDGPDSERCWLASIDASNGAIGQFQELPRLPYGMKGGAMVIVRGRLTLFGAVSASVADNAARIFSVLLEGGGAWERSSITLPDPRWMEDAKVLVP